MSEIQYGTTRALFTRYSTTLALVRLQAFFLGD